MTTRRLLPSGLAAGLGAALTVVLLAGPAAADPGLGSSQGNQNSGSTNGGTVTLTNTGTTPGGTTAGTPGGPGGGSAGSAGGGGGGGGAPVRRVDLIGPCPMTPDGRRTYYYGYERLVNGVWQLIPGTAGCHPERDGSPPPPPPPSPAEITEAARQTVQARITVDVAPFDVAPDGRTLANLATRFRAAEPERVDGTLTNPLTGASISYSIVPRPLQWDFGDGGSASGTSVEHAYRRVGTFTVTLSGAWAVSFTAEGGTGTQTLPDATDATSRQVVVTEARARLVG